MTRVYFWRRQKGSQHSQEAGIGPSMPTQCALRAASRDADASARSGPALTPCRISRCLSPPIRNMWRPTMLLLPLMLAALLPNAEGSPLAAGALSWMSNDTMPARSVSWPRERVAGGAICHMVASHFAIRQARSPQPRSVILAGL